MKMSSVTTASTHVFKRKILGFTAVTVFFAAVQGLRNGNNENENKATSHGLYNTNLYRRKGSSIHFHHTIAVRRGAR